MRLLLKWTGFHTSTTITWRDGNLSTTDLAAGMWDVFTIARQAIITAVEYLRRQRIRSGGSPVPVRLVSFISALVAQCLLKQPCEVTMPGEEVSLQQKTVSYFTTLCSDTISLTVP